MNLIDETNVGYQNVGKMKVHLFQVVHSTTCLHCVEICRREDFVCGKKLNSIIPLSPTLSLFIYSVLNPFYEYLRIFLFFPISNLKSMFPYLGWFVSLIVNQIQNILLRFFWKRQISWKLILKFNYFSSLILIYCWVFET